MEIFFISRAFGENQDQSSAKGDFYLTDEEDGLVKALTERFPHVVAVLNVGYPIDVTWAERYGVDGLVHNGFNGFVITDWGTYDTVDTAAMVQAGNCWITPGSMDDAFTKPIIDGVKNGTIDLARLQSNVVSLVRVMARFS